jgi:hypothetical protein
VLFSVLIITVPVSATIVVVGVVTRVVVDFSSFSPVASEVVVIAILPVVESKINLVVVPGAVL